MELDSVISESCILFNAIGFVLVVPTQGYFQIFFFLQGGLLIA